MKDIYHYQFLTESLSSSGKPSAAQGSAMPQSPTQRRDQDAGGNGSGMGYGDDPTALYPNPGQPSMRPEDWRSAPHWRSTPSPP